MQIGPASGSWAFEAGGVIPMLKLPGREFM